MTSAHMRLSRVSAAIALAFVLAPAPALAAGYLKLGDIKGDTRASADKKDFYKGWIELNSWSWGETRAGGGKMHMEDISAAPNAGRVSKVDSLTVKQQATGDPDRPLVDGRVPNREMKESGEKGGTEDINIGVGELQELTISKSMDKSTPKLMEAAVKGKVFASPLPRGSLTTSVPAGTCKLGARYPTAELGGSGRTYTMTGVVVTGCAASTDGSIPTETLSLNYDKIIWK